MHDEDVSSRQSASSKGNTGCTSLGIPEIPELKRWMFSHINSNHLFRRFTVEVFVILFRFGVCMVDNAIPMIRR